MDEDILEGHLATQQTHYRRGRAHDAMARARKDAKWFTGRHAQARQLAALEHARGGSVRKVRAWLGEACAHAESAFEIGGPWPPYVVMTWLSLAILCEREAFRSALQDAHDFTDRADRIFHETALAMQGLAAARVEEATEHLRAGQARATGGDAPSDAREVMGPLLMLIEAGIEQDPARLVAAIEAAHAESAVNHDETIPVDADGLLNVVGLGLLQLAVERGLQPQSTSPYLPTELLRGL